MVQKVYLQLEDNLAGGPAEGAIAFGRDGHDYKFDLSTADAQRLREALRPFVAATRKAIDGNRCHSKLTWKAPHLMWKDSKASPGEAGLL